MLRKTNGKRVYNDFEAKFYKEKKQRIWNEQKNKGPKVERYEPNLYSIKTMADGHIVIDMVRV